VHYGGSWMNEAMTLLNAARKGSANRKAKRGVVPKLRKLLLGFGLAASGLALAQNEHATAPGSAAPATPAVSAVAPAPLGPQEAAEAMRNWQMRTGELLKRNWGVEVLGVRLASHDWMLNFRYRVIDPVKAKPLLDRKVVPYLVDQASGARMAVPAMENIGELRQVTEAEAGRQYFLTFGNGGQIVHHGSRVDVVIGGFHAEGMIVE